MCSKTSLSKQLPHQTPKIRQKSHSDEFVPWDELIEILQTTGVTKCTIIKCTTFKPIAYSHIQHVPSAWYDSSIKPKKQINENQEIADYYANKKVCSEISNVCQKNTNHTSVPDFRAQFRFYQMAGDIIALQHTFMYDMSEVCRHWLRKYLPSIGKLNGVVQLLIAYSANEEIFDCLLARVLKPRKQKKTKKYLFCKTVGFNDKYWIIGLFQCMDDSNAYEMILDLYQNVFQCFDHFSKQQLQ